MKLLPFMLMPLVLSSCGKNSFLGTYSFQLGRDSGAHFGVYATTTNKPYTYVDDEDNVITVEGCKLMKLRLNLGGSSVGGIIDDLNIDDVTIKAYYSIGKKLSGDLGYILNFGFNLKDILETIIPTPEEPDEGGIVRTPDEGEGDEDNPLDNLPEDIFDITPENTAKFVYSTISKTTIAFNIPVSLDDLAFQLYWYGLDLYNLENDPEAHAIGTHPTVDDVNHINNDLHYSDTHDDKSFRDYHTLSLSLTKK